MGNQEIINRYDESILNDLESEIYSLVYAHEPFTKESLVRERNSDLFKRICNKAKESLEYSNQKFDQKKLCYLIAVYVLKSGLYCVLEKAYEDGFDFEDL
jgi:hypothetical protein